MAIALDKLPAAIESIVKMLNESNAGIGMVTGGPKKDGPREWAIIVVDAGEDTQKVIDAVNAITGDWS